MKIQTTHTQYSIIYNLYDKDRHVAHLEKKIAGRDAGKSILYNYTNQTNAQIRKIIKECMV